MPRPGRKQHGVMSSWIAYELDLRTLCCEPLRELSGLDRVGGVICASVSKKQLPLSENWNRFTRWQPGRQRRHTANSPDAEVRVSTTQSAGVISHPQRHSTAHRVPDQTDRQSAKTRGDPVQRPARVSQRGLQCAIPPTYRIPKPYHCDAPATGLNHAATKRNHAQNSGFGCSDSGEAVSNSPMQEQHNGLGLGAVSDEMQARNTIHGSHASCQA
jgi:hypothetical protein